MALLREHRTNLSVKVQLELAKLDPAAPTALEEGFSAQNSFQQAVSKLKSLGWSCKAGLVRPSCAATCSSYSRIFGRRSKMLTKLGVSTREGAAGARRWG